MMPKDSFSAQIGLQFDLQMAVCQEQNQKIPGGMQIACPFLKRNYGVWYQQMPDFRLCVFMQSSLYEIGQ